MDAILLHSERFAEHADFYKRAMDLPIRHRSATRTSGPGEVIARVRDPAGNVVRLLADA